MALSHDLSYLYMLIICSQIGVDVHFINIRKQTHTYRQTLPKILPLQLTQEVKTVINEWSSADSLSGKGSINNQYQLTIPRQWAAQWLHPRFLEAQQQPITLSKTLKTGWIQLHATLWHTASPSRRPQMHNNGSDSRQNMSPRTQGCWNSRWAPSQQLGTS